MSTATKANPYPYPSRVEQQEERIHELERLINRLVPENIHLSGRAGHYKELSVKYEKDNSLLRKQKTGLWFSLAVVLIILLGGLLR